MSQKNSRRVLIITDRFTPEISAPSTRLHAHAKCWTERGWAVDVLTCVPNAPRGKTYEGYKNLRYQTEWMDGFTVHRVATYMAANTGTFRRMVDYFSFNLSAMGVFGKLPRPDVILASSPPINVAYIAQAAARKFGVPWVFEIRDLWPASIRAVGASKSPLLSLVEKQELSFYRKASEVIVLTQAFRRDLVSRGVPEEKITVVTNGVEPSRFDYAGGREQARRNLGLPVDSFIVGFVGTVGMAQGASAFVEAARRLSDRRGVLFLVVGEGAERPLIERIARDKSLSNIEFRDFVPHERAPEVLAALDVGTVLLKDDPVFETVIPSKIFEIFAAARPVAAAVSGEAREVIDGLGSGSYVASPEDGAGLAEVLCRMVENRAELEVLGRAGREAVAARYNRDKLAMDALHVLEKTLSLR